MPVGGTRRRATPRGEGATVATLESAGGYRGMKERHTGSRPLGRGRGPHGSSVVQGSVSVARVAAERQEREGRGRGQ